MCIKTYCKSAYVREFLRICEKLKRGKNDEH